MRFAIRTTLVAGLVVVLAAVVVGSAAAATKTYTVAGYETYADDTTAVFEGFVLSEPGTWTATILHGDLNKSPHGVTQITGGSFVLTVAIPSVGVVSGGELIAQPAHGGKFCTQPFDVHGTLLGGGSFGGTLLHYGTREHGVCNAAYASFTGWLVTTS